MADFKVSWRGPDGTVYHEYSCRLCKGLRVRERSRKRAAKLGVDIDRIHRVWKNRK